MTKRSKDRSLPCMVPLPPASLRALASGPVNAFFADLFIRLNQHLALATTPAGKALAVQEARQYLRGAEALWDCTKPLSAVPGADGAERCATGTLLEHLFLDANAYIAEVENQLAQADPPSAMVADPEEEGARDGTRPSQQAAR